VIGNVTLAVGKIPPLVKGNVSGDLANGELLVQPFELNLGASQPALLDGHIDSKGLALHLAGPVSRDRLLALAAAVPPLGDGIEAALPPAPPVGAAEAPIHVDLTANRTWATGEIWAQATPKPVKRRRSSQRN